MKVCFQFVRFIERKEHAIIKGIEKERVFVQ